MQNLPVIHLDRQGSGGGSGTGYIGVFTNYTDLTTQYPTAPTLSLAYVQNNQGTAWLPGGMGGTFYSKGSYLFDGVNWVSSVDDISKELQDLLDEQYKIKITASDTTGGYLKDKIATSDDLSEFTINPGANEELRMNLFPNNKVWYSSIDPNNGNDDSVPNRHRVGQIWNNTTSGNFFIAQSLVTGAAVWLPINTSLNSFLLDRANHTGTQLANTISNFAATVRATILTGISFATSTTVTAADSILIAIGKLQAQITQNNTILILNSVVTPTPLAANTNNWTIPSLEIYNVIKAETDGLNYDVTGIDSTNVLDGQTFFFYNIGLSGVIKFKNNNAGSIAANRIILNGDINIKPGMGVVFSYDTGYSRWRVNYFK